MGRAMVWLAASSECGEVAVLVSERGEADLEVQRDRVVDLGADLAVGQVVAQRRRGTSWGTRITNWL